MDRTATVTSNTLMRTTLPFPGLAHIAGRPRRRLVIVVRADPVICGHSGEARCLA